ASRVAAPELYPAEIPPAGPARVRMSKPELMVPKALIEIWVAAEGLAAALLTLMPRPRELIMSPVDVVSRIFEALFVLAWMPARPYSGPAVIVALLRTSTFKSPNDKVSPVPTGLAGDAVRMR